MPAIAAIYAQELLIGLPWTAVHCAGMCGPILAGVRGAMGTAQGSPDSSAPTTNAAIRGRVAKTRSAGAIHAVPATGSGMPRKSLRVSERMRRPIHGRWRAAATRNTSAAPPARAAIP